MALDALVVEMLDKGAAVRPSADSVARELGTIEGHLLTESGGDKHEAAAPGLREGDVVDKYRIERRIGEGGMGIVMAARHVELGKRVALKVLRGSDPADVPRFLREAQAASRLESEHVARVLDVGRTPDGAPFIVMEYLSGSDLARRLVERGPLPVRTAVGYVLEACEAIAESHSLGIVHRDLKPSNLFVVSRRDGSELVKVLDFGISKLTRPLEGASAGASMTGASAVIGSASYMSPEQLASSKHVDERTDIWALGVVLHELITGARPFEGDSAAAVGARIAASEPRRLRELAKDAPEALEAVILACLVKDPDRRMPNVAALVTALLPFRSPEAPVSAESAGPPQEGPAAFVTRARVGVGIAALVVVAGVGVIATMRGDADKATRPAADAAPVVVTAEAPVATSPPPAGGRPAPEPTASAPSASSLAVQPATGVPGATAPREASPAATQRLAPPARDPVAPSTRPGAGAASSPPPAAATVRPKSDLDLRDPALEGR